MSLDSLAKEEGGDQTKSESDRTTSCSFRLSFDWTLETHCLRISSEEILEMGERGAGWSKILGMDKKGRKGKKVADIGWAASKMIATITMLILMLMLMMMVMMVMMVMLVMVMVTAIVLGANPKITWDCMRKQCVNWHEGTEIVHSCKKYINRLCNTEF